MVWHNTTGKAIHVNADRSEVVDESSPDAAFQLVGPHGTLEDDEAARLGLAGGDAPTEPSALERERAAHDAAVTRGAFEEAKIRRAAIADLEAREQAAPKARRAAADKAVKPAENKGQ